MELYRDIDIQAITDKLDQIVEEATNIKKKTLEPTLDECKDVKEVINDFIMKKKRIVYGGTAYNTLITQKSKKDAIYGANECKDVEFYSPKPIEDIMELADILHEKKFKFVQVRQAMHAETYTLFVNFEQYCDVSYMPSNIFLNMPAITIDGILYSHPTWILVDILRQYNDPITSYWRLKDKTFFRANVLLKFYPLELAEVNIPKPSTSLDGIKEKIFKEIANFHTLIHLGSIAETYYLTRSSTVQTSNLEVISTNFSNDVKLIAKIIEKILGSRNKDIVINPYKPYFQFRDECVDFVLDGITLIRIMGSNGKCIPYNILNMENSSYSKIDSIQLGGYYKSIKPSKRSSSGGSEKKPYAIKLATFMVLFQHLLVERHYWYTSRSDKYKEVETLIKKILTVRNEYLKSKSLTVMDSTPYKEFIIRCTGDTIDQGREFRLGLMKRKAKGAKLLFTYDPDGSKSAKVPEYKFDNTSGNLDKNGVKKIFEK
jgi:hypothetical protein